MIENIRKEICKIICQPELKYKKQVGLLEENNRLLIETNTQINLELINVKDKYDDMLADRLDPFVDIAEYWDTKYPKKIIEYAGRSLPFKRTTVNVPVSALITPYDPYIQQDLVDWDVFKIIENWDERVDGDVWETVIPMIYRLVYDKYYKYETDIIVWGTNEVWEYPWETRVKINEGRGVDCDSWAILLASYYIGAGCPSWRVRCVAGDTSYGGHATNYIFSSMDNRFHHLNSTYGDNTNHQMVYMFYTHDDASEDDKLGIQDVWFSFNDKFSWSKFDDKYDLAGFEIVNLKR